MNHTRKQTARRWAGGLVATIAAFALFAGPLAVLSAPAGALAADKVTTKSGQTYEGDIVRELDDGTLFLEISIGEIKQRKIIPASDIAAIERDAVSPDDLAEEEEEARAIPEGATRVAFISLEEMVGPYFNKDAIERSVNILKEMPENEKPEIIVFVVDSGGGALYELELIIPYIKDEVRPYFRTVGWIRSAISAAAMTSWIFPEFYMMSEGNIGACTGYRTIGGKTQAMAGEELEEVLIWMERVSGWGGHPPEIMRAMQVYETLSADIDEDGDVTWYLDDSGEYLVSPENQILTFNSIQAKKFGLSRGTADTKEELADAMGLTEWVEVGHEADEYQREFRENVRIAETRTNELLAKMDIAINSATSSPNRDTAERFVGQARRYLRELRSLIRRAPSLELYQGMTPEWFDNIDRQLRQILNPQAR